MTTIARIDFPDQVDPEMSVEEARRRMVCRVCQKPIGIDISQGLPVGWHERFGEQVYPVKVTFNFGKEFAHTDCLGAKK